ncbi:MAG: hypothetical protein P4L33_12270 [Capsulimonadaceae bacterium]|nr:hypothetical protein [Capsulimonadaceae bacterium]
MARTWSYRKREIVINEVHPRGVPAAAVAMIAFGIVMIATVLGFTVYATEHQAPEPVIVGLHSDSYRTQAPGGK